MKLESPEQIPGLLLGAAITLELPADLENQLIALLDNLARSCQVRFNEAARTARISRASTGLLVEVAPSFLEEMIKDPDELLFLMLHELSHGIFGDLDLLATSKVDHQIQNLALDIRINSLIRTRFGIGDQLLERCYRQGPQPARLLIPPDILDRRKSARAALRTPAQVLRAQCSAQANKPTRALSVGDETKFAREFAALHSQAWAQELSGPALIQRLVDLLPSCPAIRFLGNHDHQSGAGKDATRRLGSLGPLGDEARRLIAGEGRASQRIAMRTRRYAEKTAVVHASLRHALEPDPIPQDGARNSNPARHHGRELFLLGLGAWPIDFPARGDNDEEGRARVFLDVSGSTHRELPAVLGALQILADLIRPPIYEFSTKLHETYLISDLSYINNAFGAGFGQMK